MLLTMPRIRSRAASPRPAWDFGRKVAQLLLDRTTAAGRQVRPSDLARDLELDHGTVMDWIHLGRSPRSKTGRAVAAWFDVDAAWLLDDAQPYPPPKITPSVAESLRAIPPELRDALRDPRERAALLALWRAHKGGA
jgi:hypothetical protein